MPGDAEGNGVPADSVYDRLRRIAGRYLARERPDHTLQPTALVHEAWLRLARYRTGHELSAGEFQILASHVMRRVLTDYARSRRTDKRDAERRVQMDEDEALARDGAEAVLEVDEALRDLAEQDPELARVVELRFFGGHTLKEIAGIAGISPRTVNRRWQLARAWLLDAMSAPEEGP